MRRRLARFLFVFVLGLLAMVLGVVTSMTLTPPGRDLLARTVSRMLDRIVLGHVEVGAISGSFLYDLVLQDLVVRSCGIPAERCWRTSPGCGWATGFRISSRARWC
jgi:autotransporter translocation and assembly factor TamB